MPRYELDDGTLRRFCEISRSGAEITVRTGTIGEPGKARTKDHRTEARARAVAEIRSRYQVEIEDGSSGS